MTKAKENNEMNTTNDTKFMFFVDDIFKEMNKKKTDGTVTAFFKSYDENTAEKVFKELKAGIDEMNSSGFTGYEISKDGLIICVLSKYYNMEHFDKFIADVNRVNANYDVWGYYENNIKYFTTIHDVAVELWYTKDYNRFHEIVFFGETILLEQGIYCGHDYRVDSFLPNFDKNYDKMTI